MEGYVERVSVYGLDPSPRSAEQFSSHFSVKKEDTHLFHRIERGVSQRNLEPARVQIPGACFAASLETKNELSKVGNKIVSSLNLYAHHTQLTPREE